MVKARFPLAMLIFVILASGCIGSPEDVSRIAKSIPEVQELLNSNPNADIRAVLWEEKKVKDSINTIQNDCGSDFKIREYYKIDVTDGTNNVTAWYDNKDGKVICILRNGLNINVHFSKDGIYPTTSNSEEIIFTYLPRYENGTNVRLNGVLNISIWTRKQDENLNTIKDKLIESLENYRIDDTHYNQNDKKITITRTSKEQVMKEGHIDSIIESNFLSDEGRIFQSRTIAGLIENKCKRQTGYWYVIDKKIGNSIEVRLTPDVNEYTAHQKGVTTAISSTNTDYNYISQNSEVEVKLSKVDSESKEIYRICGKGRLDSNGKFTCTIIDDAYQNYEYSVTRTDCYDKEGGSGSLHSKLPSVGVRTCASEDGVCSGVCDGTPNSGC